MAEPAYREFFYRDEHNWFISISTEIKIDEESYIPIVIEDDDLEDDSWEEYESITDSESLTFQNCRSSYIQFTTKYIDYYLYGQWIDVNRVIAIDEEHENYLTIPIGRFYVAEDNISRDGITQEIVAYDAMYLVINCSIEKSTDIYRELRSTSRTVKDFRDNFFNRFAIEQENVSLINDDIVLPAIQIEQDDLYSAEDIVKMLAELNAVFPHINKDDGLLHWIELETGDVFAKALYPGFYPGPNAYPQGVYKGTFYNIYKNHYIENSVVWSSHEILRPDGVQVRNENNDVVYFANSADSVNPYTIINNFLIYELNYGQCQQIAERIYDKIKDFTYVPFEMTKMGDLCVNVGDRVVVHVENGHFVSYIFNKHTTGIANPFEDIQTSGTYDLSQYDVNKTQRKLKNLDNRIGNIEKSGSGPLQIVSVATLPDNPQLNVLYLIQGEVTVT